jgi:hypothetical protein
MPLIRGGIEIRTRPLTQSLSCFLKASSDELTRLIIADSKHEEVADVFDIRVVAVPISPENVGECAEVGKFRRFRRFAVAVPGSAGGVDGAVKKKSKDG